MTKNLSADISLCPILFDRKEDFAILTGKARNGKEGLIQAASSIEWMRSFSEIIDAPVALIRSVDGQFCYLNQRCYEFLRMESDGIENKKLTDYVVFNDDFEEIKEEIYSNGSVTNRGVQILNENGKMLAATISLSQIYTEKEECFLISFIDLSGMQTLAEEQKKLLEELEISKDQVEEEAGKLVQLNVQLEESEEKLRELNAGKDKLFSIIGHDLKNPFHVISSYAEILLDEYETLSDDQRKEFIEIIHNTITQAQKLLENLLNWSRAQSGRIEFQPEPLILRKMVSNSVRLLSSLATKKNIQLTYNVSVSAIASADKNMLDTILRNLISNAIKFTNESGSVTITVKETDNDFLFTVRDTGIGISEKDLRKLFRLDVNNIEIGLSKEKGTGLGLILCKDFIERHQGTIWVESELGQGSTFNFTLPKSR
jgi:PAS domain S-box-containing protein